MKKTLEDLKTEWRKHKASNIIFAIFIIVYNISYYSTPYYFLGLGSLIIRR